MFKHEWQVQSANDWAGPAAFCVVVAAQALGGRWGGVPPGPPTLRPSSLRHKYDNSSLLASPRSFRIPGPPPGGLTLSLCASPQLRLPSHIAAVLFCTSVSVYYFRPCEFFTRAIDTGKSTSRSDVVRVDATARAEWTTSNCTSCRDSGAHEHRYGCLRVVAPAINNLTLNLSAARLAKMADDKKVPAPPRVARSCGRAGGRVTGAREEIKTNDSCVRVRIHRVVERKASRISFATVSIACAAKARADAAQTCPKYNQIITAERR
ncbi:hypothetical protein EVAR_92702_1 [Eumeta japonica]|uniref:Uncharacterized protein n=1 Tax=Eumeta variegata TaxID=151549 RepID=A0A4C1T0I5_EUMVA|nr:hypothetical protein EVAR_92702_1 [Eumeta japonica]